MSEKLQCFVLFLPTIGGQDAVDVLLDGIVFPHTFFQASVLSVQPILFFGQSGIFLAQILFLVTGFFVSPFQFL